MPCASERGGRRRHPIEGEDVVHEELVLERMDRDGALQEAVGGLTRGRALRAVFAGVAGAAAGGALLGGASTALGAPTKKNDIRVLQLALVLEHLGATFYGEAAATGALRGETLTLARTLHAHEVAHVAFVEKAIRGLGGRPAAPPRFDFGSVTHSASRFRKASASLEELCVEALNGAGPLVTKPTLKGAAQLVSVEARHVAWVRDLRGVDPVPAAFDRAATAAQTKSRAKASGFIKTSF
jgi:hypothetical protein